MSPAPPWPDWLAKASLWRTSHSVATERVGVSIHNPVGDTYFTILLRTHPGRWGKSSSSQSIGTSRPGSHSGEATSDSNAQAGGSSLRLSTGGVHSYLYYCNGMGFVFVLYAYTLIQILNFASYVNVR